ncbi:phage tail tape measure protein [Rhodococcus sp. SGAir0479]|uniref:phage tail tape measure protein n=1 Tax=Rhodococcus sp. SGAir0479 TaxID=2567884 RepID=UPI0020C7A0E6|nr:phage tail tape measure protein [Rhodococcus sp. SGAir0479]
MAGGRIDIEVGLETGSIPAQLQSGMQPALGMAKRLAGTLGLALGGAALVSAGKQVIKLGNEYTTSLNEMAAVSQASAAQMAIVSERAKQLGNDIELPNTSASDAALAMTELAKGGFSVDQAMSAAKGTLQLAAAAGVDAAQAATIQSQALQAYGLDASYAATAADVLANAANASSAEITDVAYGLAQAGTVTNQFGVSLEDTAATIGLFANAGITGSDAGTLLKTALLSLTDQGKPAQAAIEDLGLTIYNAQGKFVGMRELFAQLKTASERMTDEQYQAATATLFGSDAMRLAGIAAEQGVTGYDSMREAISRQGAAAEVAAAKTQGLPGAIGSVQNAAEDLSLRLYDLVDGPLESLARGAADKITDVTPTIISGIETAGSVAAKAASEFMELDPALQAAAVAAVAFKVTGLGGFLSDLGGRGVASLRGFNDELRVQQSLAAMSGEQVGRLTSSIAVLETRVPAIASMGAAYRSVAGPAADFATRQVALAAASGPLTGSLRAATGEAVRLGGAFAGTAVAGVRGLGSALGGVVSAFGGPWAAGLAAAGIGLTAWMASVSEAKALTKQYDDAVRQIAVSQSELGDILARSKGKFDDLAIANVTSQVSSLAKQFDAAAANDARWTDVTKDMIGDVVMFWRGSSDDISQEKDRIGLANRQAAQAIQDLGMTDQQVAQAMLDNAKWSDIEQKLRGMGDGGGAAADKLNEVRQRILETRDVAQNTTPGFFGLSEAVKTLADDASSAADRTNALKTALDILSGKPIDVGAAMQAYNRQIRETAEATRDVWDASLGFGQALKNADGSVNTTTTNGDRLLTKLNDIKDATIQAAASGADMAPIWQKNEEAFQQLATATGLSVGEIRKMSEEAGLLPKNFEIVASLKGADSVKQELVVVKGLLDRNAEGIEIPTTALTKETLAKLDEVKISVENVDGKPGIVRLSAPNEQTLADLQAVIDKELPGKTVVVDANTDPATSKINAVTSGNYFANVTLRVLNPNPIPAAVASNIPSALPLPGQPKALGGEISGGIRGKDSVPILAMPGEHMLTTDDVDRLGGQAGVYRFRAALQAGLVRGYANGGEIVDSMTAVVQSRFPGMQMSSGLRFTDNGHHSTGHAADFSNGYDSTPEMRALAAFIADNYLSQTLELIHSPFDRNIKNGAYVGDGMGFYGAGTMAEHRDHVHWAVNGPVGQPQAVVLGYSVSSDKKKEWTEKDELDLQRARIAVDKARDDLNPKKDDKRTPRDYEDDRIQLRQAEIRVEDLEREKAAALRGEAPAPPAPALGKSMSNEQLDRLEAQLAVDRASRERDEVYAKPDRTPGEMQEADIALMRANNRKADLERPSGLPSTWSELFGEVAKEFVSSNVSDVLGYYGASDDLGPLINAGLAVAKAAPDGFGADGTQPAVQLPSWITDLVGPEGQAAAFVPDWAKAFLQSLGVKVYDNGGALEPGDLGLNLSRQREFVLNPRETVEMEATREMFQSFRAIMRSSMDQPAAAAPQPADTFDDARQYVFQLPNGYDSNAVATGIHKARQIEQFETAGVWM